MIENILFPVDFSPACMGMTAYVKRVAALFRSRITLLHVCDLESHSGFEISVRAPQEIAEEHWTIGRQKLDSFLPCDFPAPVFPRVLRSGDPSQEIVNYARSGGFDLIVMPTHAGRLRQTLLGSTTAKVLDDADCMMMTRGHAETEPPKAEQLRWVCGIDFGPESERIIRLVSQAAEQVHARVSFIHVGDASGTRHSDVGFDGERKLSLERLADQGIQVVSGHVKEVLLGMAERAVADALIVGRSPKHDLLGRLRDLTYALIRDSTVPVLSV